ncbi:MAG TPA: hypothetical protein VE891_02400 [Allosphingosinicella sp.]|nr:hypothetical protein [Allosphingosinicella sp.]
MSVTKKAVDQPIRRKPIRPSIAPTRRHSIGKSAAGWERVA